MIDLCTTPGCFSGRLPNQILCNVHHNEKHVVNPVSSAGTQRRALDRDAGSMTDRYPRYYKRIPAGVTAIDVYAVCQLFPVADDTGAINHARKKLLIPGNRTGGKSLYDDVKEARDTLTRWLELNVGHTNEVTQAEVIKR